jgi:hypothetical protein
MHPLIHWQGSLVVPSVDDAFAARHLPVPGSSCLRVIGK